MRVDSSSGQLNEGQMIVLLHNEMFYSDNARQNSLVGSLEAGLEALGGKLNNVEGDSLGEWAATQSGHKR